MRKEVFINQDIYHIYNRGVEKRQIFMDDYDYLRFIHNLFEFNDTASAGKFSESRTPKIDQNKHREMLVEILCFCLMPNHLHLILRQLVENGISDFMKKLSLGYAMFFNKKYERVGPLFQGRYKVKEVKNDEYFLHLSRYIHLNPVELIEPDWKKLGIRNLEKMDQFLQSYRWSSYPDYLNKKNFPSITSRDFLISYMGGQAKYKKFVDNFVVGDLNDINQITFE